MLLTVREAAGLLHSSERQLYRWVSDEEVPFQRVRGQVRFNRTDLLEWATSRRLPISLGAFDAGLDEEDRAPSLGLALRAGGVHAAVPGLDRASALREMVERTPIPASLGRQLVAAVLQARASPMSMALAEGIAVPHVRHPIVAPGAPPTVSVSYFAAPVPLGAADEPRAHTACLIVSPTVRMHLQQSARLARALLSANFRGALERRVGTDELAAEASRLEAGPSSIPPPPRPQAFD